MLNSLSHAVGAVITVGMLWTAVRAARQHPSPWAMSSGVVYVVSVLVMFLVSSIYHGLTKGMPKQVMRVVDHCDIFFTIAGTYTPSCCSGC